MFPTFRTRHCLIPSCALLLTAGIPSFAAPRTIAAAGLSPQQVQAAVDRAADGDTVVLPAGTATWDRGVTVSGKRIIISGAGIDKTTIVGGAFAPSAIVPTHCVFSIEAEPGGLTRLTALTIDGGQGSKDDYNKGMVAISGASTTWRVDHVRMRATRTCGMRVYASGGVIDHCRFDLVGWFFAIYGFNGAGVFGDESWTEAAELGKGDKSFFVEDCLFEATNVAFALDGWKGERVVFRHNRLHNAMIGNHGTETSGRLRGGRSFEIYDNVLMFTADVYAAIEMRSGNGVIYNNAIAGKVKHAIRTDNYRDATSFEPWGIACGESPFDKNDVDKDGKPVVYETGAHSGASGARVLICAGKQWKPDQWVGYSVHNAVTGKSSIIETNTRDTIVPRYDESHSGPNLLWSAGDAFRIERCLVALDQTGRGKGTLISGDVPSPARWPRQEPEQTYVWRNTLNGAPCKMISGSAHIREGMDFYNKPPIGYTAHPYPHALTRAK